MMILVQHSGRPVVKHVELSGLRNFLRLFGAYIATSKRVMFGV